MAPQERCAALPCPISSAAEKGCQPLPCRVEMGHRGAAERGLPIAGHACCHPPCPGGFPQHALNTTVFITENSSAHLLTWGNSSTHRAPAKPLPFSLPGLSEVRVWQGHHSHFSDEKVKVRGRVTPPCFLPGTFPHLPHLPECSPVPRALWVAA